MLAVQTKAVAAPAKKNTSFFNKESEPSFFHPTTTGYPVNQSPFFSKSPNRSLGIQTKLNIGQPGDVYEKEADSMADKVVQRLSEPSNIQKKDLSSASPMTSFVQKKCAHCEEEQEVLKKVNTVKERIQKKPFFENDAESENGDENIQRKCAECEKEEKLQKKSDSSIPVLPPNIESRLSSSKDSGAPLPKNIRAQMESSFGADFSNVRIHNNSSAEQMSKDLNAQAFTHGSDIYFNSGKYDMNSSGGKHLLAHELTHTIQQTGEIKKKVIPNIQKDDLATVELVGPVNSYTIRQTGDVINVGEAAGTRILLNVVLGFGGTVTLTWYNFSLNISETGDLREWLNFRFTRYFYSGQGAFDNLSAQLSASQWRSLGNEPLTKLLEMHEQKLINIPDEVLLSSYKGMIYVEAKAALKRNEDAIDELLNATDRVRQIQEYSDGLREASIVRDTMETRKSEIEHSLTQAHSFTFGIAGNFQNMDMARRLNLLKEKGNVEHALEFWYQAFPLLTRFRTSEIRSEAVELKLREIRENIILTRPHLDEALTGSGPLDLMQLIPIRQQLSSRLGTRATATIDAEDKRNRRNSIIGGVLLFGVGILLLFIPGGIFIDAAIGIAIAANAISDAFVIGRAANTGLHVDDGLMTQGQAQMAEFNAVLSTVFAVIGAAAAGFRVLKVGVLFSRISAAAPELTMGSRMNLARMIAKNPGLITTFRRTTQELELELGRLNLALTFEEIQGLRAAMFRYHHVPVVSTSRESIEAFLQRVWNARTTIRNEDGVYKLYSAATEANPLNMSNADYLMEIQKIIKSRPTEAVSNLQSGTNNALTGFHRFLRPGLSDAQLLELAKADKIAERIYLNTNSNKATEVMGFVVHDIIDNSSAFPGVVMAKLTGPGAVARRADAIVIYCETPGAAQSVLQKIREYHRLNPSFFQRSAPPMTQQVMEGVGLASEPLGVAGQASFGGTRSASIFEALHTVMKRGGTQKEFMDEVFNVLRKKGFNPDAPNLNLPPATPTFGTSGTVQRKLEPGNITNK